MIATKAEANSADPVNLEIRGPDSLPNVTAA